VRRTTESCSCGTSHVRLVSLEQFQAFPWCPGCGPCDGLTSGWLGPDDEPSVLYCKGCGTPVVDYS